MKKSVTWILIADGARARIWRSEGWGTGLTPVTEEIEGDHRATHEIGVERPGRVQESANPGRHAMEPRVDWHQFEKSQFAKKMASHLNRAAQNKDYDRLVLIAPPKALGELRSALDKHAAGLVVAELDKDLTQVASQELPKHLEKIVPV
jgi:protein required for attachment to host cells